MKILDQKTRELCFSGYFVLSMSIVSGAVFLFVMNVEARYALYLLAFAFIALLFFIFKSPVIKISSVVFVLFFIERIFVHNRLLTDYFLVSISLVFALLVVMTESKNYDRLGSGIFQRYVWGGFLLLSFVSIFTTSDLDLTSFKVQLYVFQIHYLEFFLFFLMGFLALNNVKDVENLLRVFVFFCAIVAAAHVFSILTGINLEALRDADSVARENDLSIAKNWRYGGFFGNPNYMASLYVMVIPGCLMLLYSKKNLLDRLLAVTALVVVFASLAMTGSRGGMLFSLVNSSLVLLFYIRGVGKRFVFIAFLFVLLFGAYTIMDQYFYEQLERSITRVEDKSIEEDVRFEIWQGSLLVILNNPAGVGLSGENFANWLYYYSGRYFEHAHNAFLSIAAHSGVVGLFLFLVLVWKQTSLLVSSMRDLSQDDRLVYAFVLSVLVGYLLCSMTNGTFINNMKINHFFGLMLGVCAFLNYQSLRKLSSGGIDRDPPQGILQ